MRLLQKNYFSNHSLPIRDCCWLSTTPAFEKRHSTGAELQGTENNCKAHLDNGVSLR